MNAPKRYWLIEQPDLDDDDDHKRIHTTDLDVYPDVLAVDNLQHVIPEPFASLLSERLKL